MNACNRALLFTLTILCFLHFLPGALSCSSDSVLFSECSSIVERRIWDAEAGGSIPPIRTMDKPITIQHQVTTHVHPMWLMPSGDRLRAAARHCTCAQAIWTYILPYNLMIDRRLHSHAPLGDQANTASKPNSNHPEHSNPPLMHKANNLDSPPKGQPSQTTSINTQNASLAQLADAIRSKRVGSGFESQAEHK
jgi:hypothetical protein